MFPNPNEGAMRDAMSAAGQAYSNMRPQMAQGFQNLASQTQNAMAPAHQALANMYGGQQGQNSDVTAAINAQNQPGPTPSDTSGTGQSRSTASDRSSDDNIDPDPLGGFLNMIDPVGGLSSIGGSFGGMFGLDGKGGGPMNAARGGLSGMSGGGLLGGIGGGGMLSGLLGGMGGGGMGGFGGLPGLGGGGMMGL
jgi:hypothetical protein